MNPLRLLLALPSRAAASLPPGLSTGPSRCAAAAVEEVREVLAAPRSARPPTPPSAVVVGLEALAAVALGVSSSFPPEGGELGSPSLGGVLCSPAARTVGSGLRRHEPPRGAPRCPSFQGPTRPHGVLSLSLSPCRALTNSGCHRLTNPHLSHQASCQNVSGVKTATDDYAHCCISGFKFFLSCAESNPSPARVSGLSQRAFDFFKGRLGLRNAILRAQRCAKTWRVLRHES